MGGVHPGRGVCHRGRNGRIKIILKKGAALRVTGTLPLCLHLQNGQNFSAFCGCQSVRGMMLSGAAHRKAGSAGAGEESVSLLTFHHRRVS